MNARKKRSRLKHECPRRRMAQMLDAMTDRERELAADLVEGFTRLCVRGNATEQRTMVKAFAGLCDKIDELNLTDDESPSPQLRISRPV